LLLELELLLLLLQICLLELLLLLLEATHSIVSSGVVAHGIVHHQILALLLLLLLLLETPPLVSVSVLQLLLELEPGGQLMRGVHDGGVFLRIIACGFYTSQESFKSFSDLKTNTKDCVDSSRDTVAIRS